VRGFIGVDAGVLVQAEAGTTDIGVLIGSNAADGSGTVEADIEIACSGDFYAGDAFQFRESCRQLGCQLCRDGARSFAETLGKFEGNRKSEFTKGDAGRLLDSKLRQGDVVLCEKYGLDAGQK
jgi:hypothetical protein